MLLGATLFLQNNPSGLLAKALWILPPHNPCCTTARNSKQKQIKVFSSDCSSSSMYLHYESQPTKELYFKTELPTCAIQLFLNKNYAWHFSRVRHFDNRHMLFHNVYHENSFSLHGFVARHAFLLQRTFLGGSFFSQRIHFLVQVNLHSKNLPAMML